MPEQPVTTKFTVTLDTDTDATFKRLTDRIGEHTGRLRSYRGLRYPSRADVLRAMLVVVEASPELQASVLDQVLDDATRYTDTEFR